MNSSYFPMTRGLPRALAPWSLPPTSPPKGSGRAYSRTLRQSVADRFGIKRKAASSRFAKQENQTDISAGSVRNPSLPPFAGVHPLAVIHHGSAPCSRTPRLGGGSKTSRLHFLPLPHLRYQIGNNLEQELAQLKELRARKEMRERHGSLDLQVSPRVLATVSGSSRDEKAKG